jgi:hypothetical protein
MENQSKIQPSVILIGIVSIMLLFIGSTVAQTEQATDVKDKGAIDQVFPQLVSNDAGKKESTFKIDNPDKDVDISNLKIKFNEVCGKVNSYKVTSDKEDTKSIKKGSNEYTIQADITMAKCADGKLGYQIDWIPELTLDTLKYTKEDWAWWNASWTARHEITLTNTNAFTIMQQGIKMNVSSITCAFPDKQDIRVLKDDTTEIPSAMLSDNQTLVFVADILPGTNSWGYVYCNSSATYPSYTTGFGMLGSRNDTGTEFKIALGGIDAPVINITLGAWMHGRIGGGYNFTGSSTNAVFPDYNGGIAAGYIFGRAGVEPTCVIVDSNPIYIRIDCLSAASNFALTQEFWLNNTMWKYTPTLSNFLVGLQMQGLGGVSTQKTIKYMSSPHTYTNATGNPFTFSMYDGLAFATAAGQAYGWGYIFNGSVVFDKAGANTSGNTYARVDASDPLWCMGGVAQNCVGGVYINYTKMGYDSAHAWLGYSKLTDSVLNQTFDSKMYPATASLGIEGQLVLTSTISDLTVTPSPANITSVLICNATPTSVNGTNMTVEWQWLKDGVTMFSGNTTSRQSGVNTLVTNLGNPGNSSLGQMWNCTIRGSDGTNTTGWITAGVTISNVMQNITMKGIIYNSDAATVNSAATYKIYNYTNDYLFKSGTVNATGGYTWSRQEWNGTSYYVYVVGYDSTNISQGMDVQLVNMSWI